MISPAGTRMSFEGYIQDALIESLKEAGKYTDSNPKITLSGTVDNLYFSTTDGGLSDGHWDIQLRVNSSNGKFLVVSEHYKFKASYFGITACNNASKAFFPAVQEMISKLVSSKEFGTLVATKAPQHHHKRNRG